MRQENWELRSPNTVEVENSIKAYKRVLLPLFDDSNDKDFLNIFERRANLEDLSFFRPVGVCEDANMEYWLEGAKFVIQSIDAQEPIYIYGDYDVDGMTATATLYTCLKKSGAQVEWYIPSRTEGYGLHVAPFEQRKPGLIITVDTGITNITEVSELKALGFKVMVTDHHLPGDTLPQADAILNPKTKLPESDDEYMASGCYVAAKLGLKVALLKGVRDRDIDIYCDALTAMSIVSDMIPLNPTMRRQLSYGLSALGITRHIGLRALLNVCNYNSIFDPNVFLVSGANRPITSSFLAFMVVPKLNSAGRMDEVSVGMGPLLHEADPNMRYERQMLDAVGVAIKLQSLNQHRKLIENQICNEAVAQAKSYIGTNIAELPPAIVVHGKDWKAGIIGIVAAKLVSIFGVTTVVLSGEGDEVRGSGRAPEGVDLHSALSACKDILTRFGGHRAAAGLSIKEENIPELRTKLVEALKAQEGTGTFTRKYDAVVSLQNLRDVRFQTCVIDAIEPTGAENEPLVLLLKNVKVAHVTMVRETSNMVINVDGSKETNLNLSKFRSEIDFVSWLNKMVDVLVSPDLTYYNGTTSINYTLVSIREHQDK